MPILSLSYIAIGLLKRAALKGGLALSSQVLKELASNPEIARALTRVAEDLGRDAGQDLVSFLLENIHTVGDLLQHLSDYLDWN